MLFRSAGRFEREVDGGIKRKEGTSERIAEGLSDRETEREKQRRKGRGGEEAVGSADPGPGRKPQGNQ